MGAPRAWEEQMNELSEFPVLGGMQTGPEKSRPRAPQSRQNQDGTPILSPPEGGEGGV